MQKFFRIIKSALKSILIWLILTIIFIAIDSATGISKKHDWVLFFFILIPMIFAIWTPTKKLITWAYRVSNKKPKRKKSRALSPHMTITPPGPSSSAGPKDELAYIDTMDGHTFEHFVADLLRKLGYEHVEVTPGSGDQGVDIIARKNGTRYAIQCKRYSKKLGNKPVQEAYAGKAIYGCNIAVVVTNNYFTEGAKEAARSTGVLLWDRHELKQMIRFSNWKNL